MAARWIERLRKHGLSLAEIARLLDVSADTVGLWYSGRTRYPRAEKLRQLQDLAERLA